MVKAAKDDGIMRSAFFAQTGQGDGSEAFAMGRMASKTPSQDLQ
jgi:hypothetical protein